MMKKKLFDLPFYQYELNDWQFKKRGLVNRIDRNNFIRSDVQFFESDREVDRRWLESNLHQCFDTIFDHKKV